MTLNVVCIDDLKDFEAALHTAWYNLKAPVYDAIRKVLMKFVKDETHQ